MVNNFTTKLVNSLDHEIIYSPPVTVDDPRFTVAPRLPLVDAGEYDPHGGELSVELHQAPRHLIGKFLGWRESKVIATSVNDQNVWGTLCAQFTVKSRKDSTPPQASFAEPLHFGIQSKVLAKTFKGRFLSTVNVAGTNDPDVFL